MSGHLLLISGPAGVGKTTLCNRLLEEFSSSLQRVITATSESLDILRWMGLITSFSPKKSFSKSEVSRIS